MQRMSEQNVGNFLHLPRSAVCKVTGNESQRDKRRSALILADLEAEQACVRQRADGKSKATSEQRRKKSPQLAILIPPSPGHDLVQILQPEERRSEEHTSELQSLMRISYAVFCLKKNTLKQNYHYITNS